MCIGKIAGRVSEPKQKKKENDLIGKASAYMREGKNLESEYVPSGLVAASVGVKNSLENRGGEITIKGLDNESYDDGITERERVFLSSFPKRYKSYRHSAGTARTARAASLAARRTLDMDYGATRTASGSLGPFTSFETRAKTITGMSGKEELFIQVYGKEQIEAGLDYAPALSMTLDVDKDGRVEFSIYGLPSQSNLYKQFERKGWAEPARDSDGDIIRTIDDGFWTKLADSNRDQAIELLGDAHGRALEWLGKTDVGLYWKRTTGATGTTTGREGAMYFSLAKGAE